MLKFRLFAGLAVASLGLAAPALACSCAPAQSAEAQAEGADLVAVVKVGERWPLATDIQTEEAARRAEFEDSYATALEAYARAAAAGEDVVDFETFEDQFFKSSDYRPAPFTYGASLTLVHVQRVLKGEMARHIVVEALDPGMPACGISFREGAEILLLARGGNGTYSASMCDLPQYPLADFEAALDAE